MGMVADAEAYLHSINELELPKGIKEEHILREKEIRVVRLEYIIEILLQNVLVRKINRKVSPKTNNNVPLIRTYQMMTRKLACNLHVTFSRVARCLPSCIHILTVDWRGVLQRKCWNYKRMSYLAKCLKLVGVSQW